MNQEEHEKIINRRLSPPFLVQMTSGDKNKHCDLYCNGSIHTVRTCDEGYKWVDGRVDTIPKDYSTRIIENKPEVKCCPNCKNEFEINWPFISHNRVEMCVRCYERYNFTNRDEYREIIRKELMIEIEREKNEL